MNLADVETLESEPMPGAARMVKDSGPKNVVERAIAMFDGNMSEFARRLSPIAGRVVSRQAVHNWKIRGGFSREIIPAVHQLTKIPYYDLLKSMVYDDEER